MLVCVARVVFAVGHQVLVHELEADVHNVEREHEKLHMLAVQRLPRQQCDFHCRFAAVMPVKACGVFAREQTCAHDTHNVIVIHLHRVCTAARLPCALRPVLKDQSSRLEGWGSRACHFGDGALHLVTHRHEEQEG